MFFCLNPGKGHTRNMWAKDKKSCL